MNDIFILDYFVLFWFVLSLGIPVVLSDTGGNKFFKKYDLKGLKYFSSVDQGVEAIKCFQLMDKQIRKKAGVDIPAQYPKRSIAAIRIFIFIHF